MLTPWSPTDAATGQARGRLCNAAATGDHYESTNSDETRTPAKTKVELVNPRRRADRSLHVPARWKWSECIKPVVGTETCQVEHIGYFVSGRLGVKHQDGSEGEVTAGDVYRIAPGHDAWVIGNEPAVVVEFQGAANYAKPH